MKIRTAKSGCWSVAGAMLSVAFLSTGALAQDEDDADDEDTRELDRVTITGSRIARTQIEGPAPVMIITREQIEREGFTTVEGALQSLTQATGIVQNELFAGGFTQNANALDLRGLGPGRTLILIDGRRASDYPLAYNGQSNIQNISAIPLAAVERIEVLSGGASAIYGSDAIAGVVNIIMRKDYGNSIDMNVRYGSTSDGGLDTARFQAVGGFLGQRWNVTYALEWMDREPLYAYERDYMSSVLFNPNPAGRINTRNAVEIDVFGSQLGGPTYIDPGDCDAFAGTSVEYSSRPDPVTGTRYYCGSETWVGEQSIVNGREQVNLYLTGSLEIGEAHEAYASFNYFTLDAEGDSAFRYYFNFDSFYYFPNSNGTSLEQFGVPGTMGQIQRIFVNSELGDPSGRNDQFREDVTDYAIGLRGEFFSPLWNYDLTYSHSGYELKRNRILIVEENARNYFFSSFDPNPDCLDPFGFCYPIAEINYDNLYSAITPDVWNQLTDVGADGAETSNDVVTLSVTGDLVDLPAGPLSMAAIVEWGTQEYDINLDQRLIDADYFWGLTGTGGSGDRDRRAAGLELSVPVTSLLNLTLAGRYDDYDDITNVDSAFTHNIGIELRPNEKWLFRASDSTSFRAPDMHYVFADPSGAFTFVDDRYLCERDEPNVPLSACTKSDTNVFLARQGNPLLREEEGKTRTVGFVWEPVEDLSFSIDAYRIELNDLVVDNPLSRILEIEADCRLGRRDINSGECIDALSRITRNPADGSLVSEELTDIATGPVNAATLITKGVDAQVDWRWETLAIGSFRFLSHYTHVYDARYKVFPEDDLEFVHSWTRDWRSRVRSSLSWTFDDFRATIFWERFGSSLSDDNISDANGRDLGPTNFYNLTLGYSLLDDRASVVLAVDNLFNKRPELDATNTGWPYFDIFNYGHAAVGRMIYGQFAYRFDY